MFNNKSILITGGTGSFGYQCIQMLFENYTPKRVVIFSRDELKQYEMNQKFHFPEMRYFLGDVRDSERLTQAMRGIDYVIHAAALKQVPAAEYNPMECMKTNVNGAQNVIQAALANEVEKVIALSTDKAVNPINLYGASKLASDKLFIAGNNIAGGHQTTFSVVRYGNVSGSRGSVLPYFEKLIQQGVMSLPITDVRMTRFWLSLEKGIQFVFKSFCRMQGGEIFVPKIPSIRITDLASALAPHLSQHSVGIRPGEKLHEVMCPKDEARLVVEFPDHYVLRPAIQFIKENNYYCNKLSEEGFPNKNDDFEYNSETNPHFLTIDELTELYHQTVTT
ncbi:MAG: UDP-N-acetylglucosamine 4,6-dehydratase (inverting) [Gammaproteobacteria bacterium RIFCSPLOWO2_02_FULL_42_14]|nr:MAG: UDP-N-acetylglucosamine 4,6-dehydratase (inverting) [Gammaproteobacteria bacterium RIFCSPHIGHO2_02_FULL_42_43]OGT27532.1 MAG: UDP-N-acetylglucosamine 4,6-dehydratase (inverting) [Gammaproteobacteria bacterium RIFCSPHIGHO2_01_FULL_42_8]OGT51416.1 MAG: UDP-N-acetylglucosamine 4,6-dehydratase (inverting) [Gammaproteobacteria bacterium RIFCSPHIGHO2_12_FULL_41_25]OGT62118.1 MAG: UDP-N-acetylglucosamine 4,6-dehydratase (inverting) [Gammaproteobacteria bacterium RIFCSPLOWO2_02_FULL_42_14]OGT85